VGPRFQEQDLEAKLGATVRNCLAQAEQKGIKRLAFPAMGAGFYGVPLPVSARVTLQTVHDYLSGNTQIQDVVVCLLDTREFKPYQQQLAALKTVSVKV
jgi:O-acetyl-ADP-ribose deacetylase (regulator of RNase III)